MKNTTKINRHKSVHEYSKQLIVLFMLASVLLLSSQTQSQVNLSYAQASPNLAYSNHTSGLIIDGKRIMNNATPGGYNGDGIYLSFCSNVIIRNCIIGPTSQRGIYLEGCTNITIENCIFFDNSGSIIVWGGTMLK